MINDKLKILLFYYLVVVVILKLSKTQKPNIDNKRHDVYIAGFFPYGRGVENSDIGRGVMPSVKLALDHVNEHPAILRNYRLHMWWNDTMCNTAVGVKAFFDMMHSGPHKLMLFGAACTHVTDPIAKASKRWYLTQLSYADTHPMFTKENFPNFFRIVPSENAFNSPRISLLERFNWTRVGTIYQNEPRYSLAHNRLVADLDIDKFGYQVVETQSFTNEVTTALIKLKEKDTRIILGNFNEKWARIMFCEIYKLDMYGRKYQWIIMGTYRNEWWKYIDEPQINCTLDQLEMALQYTILTDLLPLSTTGIKTIAGITAEDYNMEYDSRRGNEYSRFHGYTYDGIWAVALAIQKVAQRINKLHRNQTVKDFRYRDQYWENLFLWALSNTSFEGVTGPVRFYENERKASILIKQFQNGTEVKVGEYSGTKKVLNLSCGETLKWSGKYPPKDKTEYRTEHTRVNKTVYAILATLAVFGIIMAIVFLAFNIKFRNQRYIKMSSPQLNNLIIIGCILTYTSIIFLGLDSDGLSSIESYPYICTARVWTLMAGFSLAFGAMFSKTWRVHSIFTDVKLNKKIIKDYKLFIIVGILLFIDLVIMTTWQVAYPFYRATKQLEPYPHPSSEDTIIIPVNEYCASEHMTIFVGLIYVYKGILMIFGAFLAWETRHVSIPALNDSRHVGLSVYNVAIMCICGAAVALVLTDHQDALFLIIGVFVLFCTTATLWLVFVPKMLELRRNPAGSIDKRIRATLRPMSKTRRDSSISELEIKIKDVKQLNSKYRKILLEKENELQLLIKRLGNDEANHLINYKNDNDNNKLLLSVPLLKKEPPSATETSDITSICSLSSQDYNNTTSSLHYSDSQKKIKSSSSSSPYKENLQPSSLTQQNGDVVDKNYNNVIIMENNDNNDNDDNKKIIINNSTSICNNNNNNRDERRLSINKVPNQIDGFIPEKRRQTLKNDDDTLICRRRISVTSNKITTTPKNKYEYIGGTGGGGTHVVAKSELWDTGNQHRCNKGHQKNNRVSINQDEDENYMHRTVSERNRYSQKKEKSPIKQNKKDSNNKLSYYQSTPNVATTSFHTKKDKQSIYTTTSESELLDREILPIFQKLLTERNKSLHNIDYSFGRSCPNISIKCDIVEYL